MKKVGIVSYNMYGNFTNYGSALQTYALHKVINSLDPTKIQSVVVDYCPDILADKDVLNPIKNMWDKDPEAIERCRLSLPAIRENYIKFQEFYKREYALTKHKYTSSNFNDSINEGIDGFVCGSDTIFAVPEFGFDDGYYANYEVMRGRSVAFAASFGDYDITESDIEKLTTKLNNFKSIALRENDKLPLVGSIFINPLFKVIDPTLLLDKEDYKKILKEPEVKEPYILLYSRRHNIEMQQFAEEKAKENNWKLIEISLNAKNSKKHIMRYDAGVEEFLGLVKNAEMVVTNSFHGMIFAIQFQRPFYIFSRKLCDTKIIELLQLLGLEDRLILPFQFKEAEPIDYDKVGNIINENASQSKEILNKLINTL